MKPLAIVAALLALLSPAPESRGQGVPPPASSAYPLPRNDPNGLWKATPDSFWPRPSPVKAAPDSPPSDLTRTQRWKWADRGLLVGTVVKIFDQGLLVQCDPSPVFPSPSAGTAPRIFGTFLVKNYVSPGFLAAGDTIRVVAYPAGRFKDVDGTDRRIYNVQIRDF